MWGTFPASFEEALRPYVAGRRVLDIGAGDAERARALRSMGSAWITGVDMEEPQYWASYDACDWRYILSVGKSIDDPFDDFVLGNIVTRRRAVLLHAEFDLAHFAWPSQHVFRSEREARALFDTFPTIAYVGKNTDGTACGQSHLFEYLRHRRVEVYLPERENTLIVYGERLAAPRERIHYEEHAGLHLYKCPVLPYSATDDLYEAADLHAIKRQVTPAALADTECAHVTQLLFRRFGG